MMAAMSGMAIPQGLFSGANAFGMTGMQAIPGAHLAQYSHLQQSPVTGLTLLPATGPALFPLTVGGNGVMPGSLGAAGLTSSGLAGWAGGAPETDPLVSWHGTMMSAASPYYSTALGTAVNGGGGYPALTMESPAHERAAQVPGHQMSGSRSSSPELSGGESSATLDRTGYMLASSVPQLGLLGSYPQEASSYGPARLFAQAEKAHGSPATSISYAAAQGVPGLQSAYSAIGAGYGGMALPLGYSDGQAYAQSAMLQARSLTSAQAFHPYRRAEDGR